MFLSFNAKILNDTINIIMYHLRKIQCEEAFTSTPIVNHARGREFRGPETGLLLVSRRITPQDLDAKRSLKCCGGGIDFNANFFKTYKT